VEHTAHKKDITNAGNIIFKKDEGKRTVEILRHKWKNYVKVTPEEIRSENVE
jgi:hypothetical protein